MSVVQANSAPGPLLSISDLTVSFGGIKALDGAGFDVDRNQIRGLIGPNGSGKTTLFNCISGIYAYQTGEILFEGRNLAGVKRHQMPGLGIGRTFQNVALFPTMTVRENVLVGAHCRYPSGVTSYLMPLPSVRQVDRRQRQRADELIQLLGIDSVADAEAGSLPFGTRKRVELARALASDPKLLMLDEPAAGLNHGEVDALSALIVSLRDRFDLAVLLVEHHMSMVMKISDRVAVLEMGRKIADGVPGDVQKDPAVVRAYLGDGE